MVLANYVKLVSDVEKLLRIKDGSFRIEEREIIDTVTKKPRTLRAAVMDILAEDRVDVIKTFSTVSDKLATTLQAMHLNRDLYKYTIGITKTGVGFRTEYRVRTI